MYFCKIANWMRAGAGDLRRRKGGKEAREVKVEKVKIGKNDKGRY